MRLLVVSGGTGGHFYPGFVLGKLLRKRGHEILFIVRDGDPARKRLETEDFPYTEVCLRGLPRRPSWAWLTLPWQALRAILLARKILRAYKPAAIVATGGYLTLPIALAARWANIPRVLHESNALLGLAHRLSLSNAVLALGLPLEKPASVRTVLTGTPVREALWTAGDAAAARATLGLDPNKTTVLIFGGSQGARALNEKIPTFLAESKRTDLQVLHITGKNIASSPAEVYKHAGIPAKVLDYCDRMDLAYSAADIVISRCGASTVAELVAQRKPAILVPYPHAADGHQEANARVLEEAGAARLLLEVMLTRQHLAAQLDLVLKNHSRMVAAYDLLMLPEPAQSSAALADIVEEVAKGYLTTHGAQEPADSSSQ
jgi:UDP-N-acetylglucosamine--N-acetylmuramyl-(pentapeptide) pyrophosphoryl-undecaprenol N-acetylglucosamine transferase